MSGEKGKWARGGMFDGVTSVAVVRNLHVKKASCSTIVLVSVIDRNLREQKDTSWESVISK